ASGQGPGGLAAEKPPVCRQPSPVDGAGIAKDEETLMNPTLRLPKERLLALDPADVEAYLLARGWEADRKASSAEAGVCHLPADPEAEILLPRDRGFVDYALRLSEVLQALASAERRTAWEVLEALSAPRTDSSPNGPVAERQRAGGNASA